MDVFPFVIIGMCCITAATTFAGPSSKEKMATLLVMGFVIGTWTHNVVVRERLDRLKAIEQGQKVQK